MTPSVADIPGPFPSNQGEKEQGAGRQETRHLGQVPPLPSFGTSGLGQHPRCRCGGCPCSAQMPVLLEGSYKVLNGKFLCNLKLTLPQSETVLSIAPLLPAPAVDTDTPETGGRAAAAGLGHS